MDKWIGCNPKNHQESDKWQVRGQVLLTQLDLTDWMGEKRGRIEREKKEERERKRV